jgi:hypothetical protein
MIGKQFHRWTVLARHGSTPRGFAVLTCRCECGTVKNIQATSLSRRSNPSKSCGCLRREGGPITHGATKHGQATPEYRAWIGMKQRCYWKSFAQFRDYGGRGITVCDRWRNSFENFLADMGPRPTPGHSLDRFPDVNGNYEPSNCRWATIAEQHRNRRDNRLITHDGKTQCITAWAEECRINLSTLRSRLRNGMAIPAALTTKPDTRFKNRT